MAALATLRRQFVAIAVRPSSEPKTEILKEFIDWSNACKLRTYLGAFGCEVSAPLDIYGTSGELAWLNRSGWNNDNEDEEDDEEDGEGTTMRMRNRRGGGDAPGGDVGEVAWQLRPRAGSTRGDC